MSDQDLLNNKPPEETAQSQLLLEAVNAGIRAMTDALNKKEATAKGSIGDLIRLMQLRKELADEQPRHITVRWIGEDECDNSTD
jgi:hypothetical protein